MTVTSCEERFVGESPRNPAFQKRNNDKGHAFPIGYTRIPREDCTRNVCRPYHTKTACRHLDVLPNRRLWCALFDVPISSGHNAPKKAAECLACKGNEMLNELRNEDFSRLLTRFAVHPLRHNKPAQEALEESLGRLVSAGLLTTPNEEGAGHELTFEGQLVVDAMLVAARKC